MERGGRDKVQTVKGDTHDDLLDQAQERTKDRADKANRAAADEGVPLSERMGGERIEDGI